MFKMMETIPDQVGALLLNEEGAVIESSGDLENDERCALVIMELLSLSPSLDPKAFPEQGFKRLSIVYEDHCYVVCLSNRRVHIVKRNVVIDTNNQQSETNLISN